MNELDYFADSYESDNAYYLENLGIQKVYATLLTSLIERSNAKSVLSLGVGHSAVSSAIAELIPNKIERYLIVEGSERLISEFNDTVHRYVGIQVVKSYFEDFITEDKFDVIEVGFVLEHVDDPETLLRHISKLLAKNGRLAVTVPNARSLHRRIGFDAGMLNDMRALSAQDLAFGHKRYFDLSSLTDLLTKCGLTISETKGLMLKPLTTAQLLAAELQPSAMEALYKGALDQPDLANALYVEAAING